MLFYYIKFIKHNIGTEYFLALMRNELEISYTAYFLALMRNELEKVKQCKIVITTIILKNYKKIKKTVDKSKKRVYYRVAVEIKNCLIYLRWAISSDGRALDF